MLKIVTECPKNKPMLKVGDKLPDFQSINQNGEAVRSEDFKGKKLIIYFYPKDMTPGCTVQAKSLNEHMSAFSEKGYSILGVSADSERSHCKFIDKHGLAFPLLADEDKSVIKAFGVWGLKKFMGREYEGIKRTTFVIDEQGIVTHVIEKVKTKVHAQQLLEAIETNN